MTKINNSKYKVLKSTRSHITGNILFGKKSYNSIKNLKKDAKKRLKRRFKSADLLRISTERGEIAIRTKRKTRYGKILLIKQRFCHFYGGVTGKFIKKAAKIAIKQKKVDSLSSFFSFIERRLLSVLIRSKLVNSGRHARQLLLHGQIKVNNKVVTSPSYLIKPGDILTSLNITAASKKLREVYNKFRKYGSRRYNKGKKRFYVKKSYLPLLKLPMYLELDFITSRLILVDYPLKKELIFPFIVKPRILFAHYTARNS